MANILLDSDGNAKISDYDTCKTLAPGEKTKTICGTPKCYAPEVLSEKGYGFEVDFWLLGITTFVLLTHCAPFEESENILNDEMPDLNQKRQLKDEKYKISEITIDFVSKLLNKDPNQRLGSKILQKDIRNHPFYASINWASLEEGELKSPFKLKKVKVSFI